MAGAFNLIAFGLVMLPVLAVRAPVPFQLALATHLGLSVAILVHARAARETPVQFEAAV